MGERYDRIRDFENRLSDWSRGIFLAEGVVFQEMMDLIIEPLESAEGEWDHSTTKSGVLLVLSRMFNDFEASYVLALRGLPQQAVHGIRDAIECMLLIRLFEAEPKTALRYLKDAKQYHAGTCKALLKEKGIETPEYTTYSMFSSLAHPNVLGAISHVSEERVDSGLLRTYHFGGHRNERWVQLTLHQILLTMAMALLSVLPPIYGPAMDDRWDWYFRARATIPKLKELGIGIRADDVKRDELPVDAKKIIEKLTARVAFQYIGIPELEDKVTISSGAGIRRPGGRRHPRPRKRIADN